MKVKSTLSICFIFVFFFNTLYAQSSISSLEIDQSIQSATDKGRIIEIKSGGYDIAKAISGIATLPVIFKSTIDGWNYEIVVFEINFAENQAYLKMGSRFSLPDAQNNEKVYFAADRIPFSSKNGFKGEMKILENTLSATQNNEISDEANALLNGKNKFYEISLPGFGDNLKMGLNEDSKMLFTCGAFDKFELSGYLKSFNTVIQEDNEGLLINDGKPLMSVFNTVSVNDWQDMYFQAVVANSFHAKSYSDVGFKFQTATTAVIDLSKRQNPQNLPKCASLSGNYWKGIYFNSFDIRLPKFFKLKSGLPLTTYKGKDLFIDPAGLIGNLVAEKIFTLEEGITNGTKPLDMSLDKITVDYSCSGKVDGLFIGQIGFDYCDNSNDKFKNDYVFVYSNKSGYLYNLKETGTNKLKTTNTINFPNGSSLSLNIENGEFNIFQKYHAFPKITSDLYNNSICKDYKGNLTVSNCPDLIEWSTNGTSASIEISPLTTTSYTVKCYDKYCVEAITEPTEIVVYDKLEVPVLSSDKDETAYCASNEANITSSSACPGVVEWKIDENDWVTLESNSTTLKFHEPALAENTTHSYYTRCKLNDCISESSNKITLNILKSPLKPSVEATPYDEIVCLKKTLRASNCTNENYRWYKDDELLENNNFQMVVSEEGSYKYNVNCVDATTGCESDYYGDIYFKIERCHCAPGPTAIDYFTHDDKPLKEGETFKFVARTCESGQVHWFYKDNEISTGNQLIRSEVAGSYTYSMKCINNDGCESAISYTYNITVKELCDDEFRPAGPIFNEAIPASTTNDEAIKIIMQCSSGETLHWYNSDKEEVSTGRQYTITNTSTNQNRNIAIYTRCKNGTNCFSDFKVDYFRINAKDGPAPCGDVAVPTISANKTELGENETATLTAAGCAGTINWSNGKTGSSIQVSKGTYSAKCKVENCESASSSALSINSKDCNKTLPPVSLSGSFSINAINNKMVTLTWDYKECNPEGLEYEGSINNSNWITLGRINGVNKSTSVFSVGSNYFEVGKTYWFRVKSYSGGSLSGSSNVIAITIPAGEEDITIDGLPEKHPAPKISVSKKQVKVGEKVNVTAACSNESRAIWVSPSNFNGGDNTPQSDTEYKAYCTSKVTGNSASTLADSDPSTENIKVCEIIAAPSITTNKSELNLKSETSTISGSCTNGATLVWEENNLGGFASFDKNSGIFSLNVTPRSNKLTFIIYASCSKNGCISNHSGINIEVVSK